MTGLNLHNIAGNALAFVNPWKEMVFTKKNVEWQLNSREPVVTQSSVTIQGKMQPANLQDLAEMGYALNEYDYFRIYLSLDASQLDRIRQIGCDTFTCEGFTYRMVAREEWIQNGWTEGYCYRDKQNDGE